MHARYGTHSRFPYLILLIANEYDDDTRCEYAVVTEQLLLTVLSTYLGGNSSEYDGRLSRDALNS